MSSLSYFNTVASQWNQMREVYFDELLKHDVVTKEPIEKAVVVDLGAGTNAGLQARLSDCCTND